MEKISLPMPSKSNLYLLLVIIGLGVVIWFQGCYDKHSATKQLADAVNYPDSIKSYKLKTGELVASNKVLMLQNDDQILILTSKDKQLAALEKQFKTIKGAIQIKEVVRLVHDTIPIVDGKFKQDNDEIDLSGSVENNTLKIDSLSFHNIQSIVVGEKKTGLLSSELTIDVINSNRLISSNAIKGYVVDQKKWYENPKTQFIAGCLIGGFIGVELHQLAK